MRLTGRFILTLIILIIIAAAAGFFWSKYRLSANSGKRQVVFLTNGQVYFGSIKRMTSSTVELHDVYYPTNTESLRSDGNGANKRVTLQKLGEEIYAPENVLYLNREQLMYWENIRSDSKINEAITRFNEERQKVPSSATPSTSPSP